MFHQINELMVLGMHPASPYLRRNRSAPIRVFLFRLSQRRPPIPNPQPLIPSPRAETTLSTVHFVYIVRCSDGTLYTGYARDPEKRIAAHNAGRGAKYTLPR